jgi:hypothetical protein
LLSADRKITWFICGIGIQEKLYRVWKDIVRRSTALLGVIPTPMYSLLVQMINLSLSGVFEKVRTRKGSRSHERSLKRLAVRSLFASESVISWN